jgi:sulfoxide reductase heme-binding subunit YedZ
MLLAAATDGHLFWITSRAAGILALLLSSASVSIGLLMGGRLIKRRGAELRSLHEALALGTMGAIVVHAVTLLGDGFLHPSLLDIALPFASSYQRAWTTLGIAAGWLTLILGLSYYARTRIGVQRWRRWHRFTALAWVASIAHSLGEGTDAGQAWFLVAVGVVALPGLALLARRLTLHTPVREGIPS